MRGRPIGSKDREKRQYYDSSKVRMVKMYREMGATYNLIADRMGIPIGSISYLVKR